MVDKRAPLQEDCLPGVVISARAHVLMPRERRATAEFTYTSLQCFARPCCEMHPAQTVPQIVQQIKKIQQKES